MSMKLFVDDLRVAPQGWVLARTITEAIRILATQKVEEVSLDHDIAYQNERGEFTGKCSAENYSSVAWFIREMAKEGRPRKVWVHTANPNGADAIFYILRGRVDDLIRDYSYAAEWDSIPSKRRKVKS